MSDRDVGKLYIGGLQKDTSEDDLGDAFQKFGTVTDIWISRDRPGFGFVTFDNADNAEEALREMNGQTVAGCTLRVDHAGQKRTGGGGGGGFRGGRGGGYGGGGFGGGRGGGGYGGGGRGGGGGCYNCGESGHIARECPSGGGGGGGGGGGYGGGRGGGYGGGGRGGGGGACYSCGETGHMARECPSGGGGGGGGGRY